MLEGEKNESVTVNGSLHLCDWKSQNSECNHAALKPGRCEGGVTLHVWAGCAIRVLSRMFLGLSMTSVLVDVHCFRAV